MNQNPYLVGLELVQKNCGTSGQTALAKCILSIYNSQHPFSIGEVLWPLDDKYTAVVLAMVSEYAKNGETPELLRAGKYVYENFPHLIELSSAMSDARAGVRKEWERQHMEEMQRLYPDE